MAEEKNNTNEVDHGKILASWQFPEFRKHQRSALWYLIAIIIIGALIAYSLFTQSYIFLIIIFLFVFVMFLLSRRSAPLLNIELNEDGVVIGEKTFYQWKDIKSFWIIYDPPEVKNLYFDFKSAVRPSISISLENENPLRIRKILSHYLTEDTEKENESFSDGLQRILKL